MLILILWEVKSNTQFSVLLWKLKKKKKHKYMRNFSKCLIQGRYSIDVTLCLFPMS